MSAQASLSDRFLEPEPILRLEIIRIFAPLAILGFMSSRIAYAPYWIGDAGFQVPDMGRVDWRQPMYLSPLHAGTAWALVTVMVLSGLALSAGFRPRPAAVVFALTLAYVALADRLAAFTVTKMSPVIALALAASPCGRAFGVDAWRRRRRDPTHVWPTRVAPGSVRFFQALLCTMYCGSGFCKMHGDWLSMHYVLWTHLHDSYQTWVSWALANWTPVFLWPVLQFVVLTFEAGSPLWFGWRKSRPIALVVGLGMHLMIAVMFWPVRWFAMLMATLLVGAFLPEKVLGRLEGALHRIGGRWARPEREAEPTAG